MVIKETRIVPCVKYGNTASVEVFTVEGAHGYVTERAECSALREHNLRGQVLFCDHYTSGACALCHAPCGTQQSLVTELMDEDIHRMKRAAQS